MWDPLVISLFLLTSSRAERSSSARAVVAPFRRSPSSGHQTSIPRTGTFSAPPPPSQTPRPAPYGWNHPRHHRLSLEVLEACSTVDPPLRSSSTRTDRGNGFVVSSLCYPVFFPFRGVSPAPVNGRRRRRCACCRLSGDVKKTNRGQSAQGGRTVRKLG